MKVGQNTAGAALQVPRRRGASATVHRRTGETRETREEPAAWKLWLLRWLGLYPTLLALYVVLGPLISAWPVPVRVLLMSGLGTWSLSFVLMPRLTRWFSGWLRRPGLGL